MAEWRFAHIGFEGDDARLSGVQVWKGAWRRVAGAPITLAHPSYPHQTHQFHIYESEHGDRPVRFAACELSNGVWRFYEPA